MPVVAETGGRGLRATGWSRSAFVLDRRWRLRRCLRRYCWELVHNGPVSETLGGRARNEYCKVDSEPEPPSGSGCLAGSDGSC